MVGAAMLYLVRHAKAEAAPPGGEDAMRPLSREGREDTVLAGRGLRRIGVRVELVLTSPLRLKAEVRVHGALAPGTPAEELVQSLVEFSGTKSLALVGHEPDMGQMASFLLLGDAARLQMPFKSGQVAAVEVASLPPRAPGLLRWFTTQQQLAFIGS
jgi:phosphohistidine phosphatase